MLEDPKKHRIVNLQALRAIAASLVVVDHCIQQMVTRQLLSESQLQLAWFLGWMGVTVFFVISGLIMMRSSMNTLGTRGAIEFARRRVIRVVPLYWTATFIYLLLKSAHGTHYRLTEIIASLFFYPYRLDSPDPAIVMRPIVGQGWTLNYEMFFYALFSICIYFPRKIGRPFLIAFFPIVIIVGVLTRPLIPYADPITAWQFWTDPITLFFTAGLVLALFESKSNISYGVSFPLVGTALILVASLSIFVILHVHFPLPIWFQAGFGFLAIGSVIFCTSPISDRWISGYRYLVISGDASFSTYLFHPLALGALGALLNRIPSPFISPVVVIIVAVLICNMLGIFVHYMIERPLLALLHHRSHPVPKLPADTNLVVANDHEGVTFCAPPNPLPETAQERL